MNTETDKGFLLEKKDTTLILRTAHFSPDRGSVLHSGIYNREFSSALSAAALAGMVYMVLVMNFRKHVAFHLVSLAVFIAGFTFLMRFVFRERMLETVFNTISGKAVLSLSGITTRKMDEISLSDISKIMIETRKTGVENPDGVEFVQRISAMHGTAIPGFGEEKLFYLLTLKLNDGTVRLILAGSRMEDVLYAYDEIKDFLKI